MQSAEGASSTTLNPAPTDWGSALSAQTTRTILFALIAGGILLRLYGFDGAILDHHFLRQVDTDAIARNFADEGMNILYPRVDWRGAGTGYVESEFPLFTFLVAILYSVFGEHVELARALNLVFTVLTALVVHGFARRLFGPGAGLAATFFYCFMPMAAYFAHSVQPDTLMTLGSVTGLYYFLLWTDDGRWKHFGLSAFALAIAILIKPFNLYLGVPLAYLCWARFGPGMMMNPRLWLYGVAALAPSALWYTHASELWVTYGNTLFRAYSAIDFSWLWTAAHPGPLISLNHSSYVSDLVWRLVYLIATPGGLVALAIGIMVAVERRSWLVFWWFAAFAVTMIVLADQHRRHDYYQLPIAVAACLLMGAGAARLYEMARAPRLVALGVLAAYLATGLYWFVVAALQGPASTTWIALFTLGAIVILATALLDRFRAPVLAASGAVAIAFAVLNMSVLTQTRATNTNRVPFAERLAALTTPEDRLVIAHNWRREGWFQHRTAEGELLSYDPVEFYLADRIGWSVSGEMVPPAFLETLRQRGATHFASVCCVWAQTSVMESYPALADYLECAHTPLERTDAWVIYRLDAPRRRADGSSCMPN